MILRTADGLVAMSCKELAVTIPVAGEVRYEVSPGSVGGSLCILIPEGQNETLGRVILEVPDGAGGSDELVVASPRTLEVTAGGKVALTLSEYVQASGALSAIPAKLGEFEARIAELEAMVGLRPQMPETGTSCPSGEGE